MVRFPSGLMVKIKAEAYVLRHRTKALLTFEKDVIQLVLAPGLDDVIGLLSAEEAKAIRRYASQVDGVVSEGARGVAEWVAEQRVRTGRDRKAFALAVQAAWPKRLQGAVFQIWDHRNPVETVRTLVRHHAGSGPEIAHLREWIPLPRWECVTRVELSE